MLKQSVAYWCFADRMGPETFFKEAYALGYRGVEMVPPEQRGLARDCGLEIINHNCGSIEHGLNKIEHHPELLPLHKDGIDKNTAAGIKDLIVFCGNRDGQEDAEGLANTIMAFQQLAPYAESKQVVLLFEMFNQKDHPDYMGDSSRFGFDLCRAVNSPSMKVVYDIYHMSLMDQPVIDDLLQNLDLVTHLHLAAAAQRNCTADAKTIPYPEIVKAVHNAGYSGYWGQEFVPGEDPKDDLARAFDYMNRCL